MLFTTLKKIEEWRLVQQRIKRWSKNAFCAWMTFSQLPTVTDRALKLDYASTWYSSILESKSIFNYFTTVAARSLAVHNSSRLVQRTQNTPVHSTRVSQGSVATPVGCGGIFNNIFVANSMQNVPVKRIWKIRWELTKLST